MKKQILHLIIISLITASNLCNLCYAQYTKLLDFAGTTNGGFPYGSLFSDGTFLYGMTAGGGIGTCNNGCGVIFKMKPDGTGYTKLLDFVGASNGKSPVGSLVSSGTFLYGMTQQGGSNDLGVIFKIKPDGTGYSKLLDFYGAANGSNPAGSLISDGTFLYGMAMHGGANNLGVIFKIKPDGTGYTNLLDFAGATNGKSPVGSLISDGTFLYGMAESGGLYDKGVVFKIKPDGTGYSKILDFTGSGNGNGIAPTGSLISVGAFLYGMAGGGTNNWGLVFKIKPDGTGYSKLLDFDHTSNGSSPNGPLISDGTFLYGMTAGGGTSLWGTVFKIKLDGTGYFKLLNFANPANGHSPIGSLISDGTFLYGMTNAGGTNLKGTVFKLGLATGIIENNMATNFNVYPNPSNGMFTIATKENESILIITNVLGDIVYQQAIKNQKSEIDISKQPNGIYFLNIKTEKGIAIQKLIINE